jgi:hypothetical protein
LRITINRILAKAARVHICYGSLSNRSALGQIYGIEAGDEVRWMSGDALAERVKRVRAEVNAENGEEKWRRRVFRGHNANTL